MDDGIIKGTGNSRFLKSQISDDLTFEQFKSMLKAGTLPVDLFGINPSGWDVIGTALSKATLLQDETAAMFGLTDSAVPDDGFRALGYYKRHFWMRRTVSSGWFEQKTPETSGNLNTSGGYYIAFSSGSEPWNNHVKYADSITINQSTGVVSLNNPITITMHGGSAFSSDVTAAQVLKGKYVSNPAFDSGRIVYIESFADIYSQGVTFQSGTIYYLVVSTHDSPSKVQRVSSVYNSDFGGWELVSSHDRNAYPDSGVSGSYAYSYIGIPYDNTTRPVKIQTGSYVGTGTYGSDHPNSITFDFAPRMVFITALSYNGSGTPPQKQWNNLFPGVDFSRRTVMYPYLLTDTYTYFMGFNSQSQNGVGKVSKDGRTVSWYSNSDAAEQLNTAGYTYYWLAIG